MESESEGQVASEGTGRGETVGFIKYCYVRYKLKVKASESVEERTEN